MGDAAHQPDQPEDPGRDDDVPRFRLVGDRGGHETDEAPEPDAGAEGLARDSIRGSTTGGTA